MSFSFILLAGGESNRFKSSIPKQYHKIAGKTLIDISINKIIEFKEIKKIVIVFNRKHKKYLTKINLKNIKFIEGGSNRRESTYNALKYLKKQKKISKVLIHDAARPNFSKNLIIKIIKHSKKNSTVIPTLKLEDALKQKHKKRTDNLIRDNFFTTQTPQCFNVPEILKLHKNNKNKYKDDDFSLIEDNKETKFIEGEKKNFKITNQDDLNLMQQIYKSKIRIGIGFDVHRLVKNRKLYLGGVKIPSKVGTLGHSDGDPVLHAVIDAILGACKMGDIGEIFSDKNKKFKNVSSSKLIRQIVAEIKNKNYIINNMDINIITETPKLKKYKEKIIKNLANLCELSLAQINIKAKTTEKLGVIGQENAIAAEVILTTIKYD
jgi:2-C-methyl-D-erythritol 4-phosphate cytidylyltransferase / 2-C-methyl-D-erythritol 2,4-cyclodiphosphate synthase